MARRLWPGESAIGQRVSQAEGEIGAPMEVVGVVADVEPLAVELEIASEIRA